MYRILSLSAAYSIIEFVQQTTIRSPEKNLRRYKEYFQETLKHMVVLKKQTIASCQIIIIIMQQKFRDDEYFY